LRILFAESPEISLCCY